MDCGSNTTDLEFVQRCVSGDKGAWDNFVEKYSRLIYNYIYSILEIRGPSSPMYDKVNDIFQEIFLSLVKDNFKKLKSFKAKNGCSLASWLRQVTINQTIDYIRKLKPAVSIDAENDDDASLKDILADDCISARDTLSDKERLARLNDCIEQLDNDDKFFVELHINRDLSLEEMKDILRASRGAVDMRKSRIIEKLKDCFRHKGFQLDF